MIDYWIVPPLPATMILGFDCSSSTLAASICGITSWMTPWHRKELLAAATIHSFIMLLHWELNSFLHRRPEVINTLHSLSVK